MSEWWIAPSGVLYSDMAELGAGLAMVWATAFGFRIVVNFLIGRWL